MPSAAPPAEATWVNLMVRRMITWALGSALAVGVVGLVTDLSLVLSGRAGPLTALATGLTAAALGVFVCFAAAPGLLLLSVLTARIAGARSALRRLWPLPVLLLGLLVGTLLTDALYRPHVGAYSLIILAFAVAATLIAIAARRPDGPLRAVVLVGIGGVALLFDVTTPRPLYRELHDLLSLLTVAAMLAALRDVRARLVVRSAGRLSAILAVTVGAATLETLTVDNWAPGWRPLAWELSRYQPRMVRACRALVDIDGDGFSPVAWGGDCDDFDASRNPAQHENRRGVDLNCNGIVPPARPTDQDRGLSPPVGDPDLPANSIDTVLLVTIDCWRRDAFRPAVMPQLTALAKTGLVFSRLYTGGSRTKISLPLIMRTWDDGEPLPMRLHRAGVRATSLFAYEDKLVNGEVLGGWKEILLPGHVRWNARETTNFALAELHDTAGQKRFVWVHYFDAHYPLTLPNGWQPRPVPPGLPDNYGVYLANLSYVDQEVGRLVEGLREDGRLARTVVIITADHGEGFGQHEVPLHGISTYEMLVHVAGILLAPGIEPGRYDGLVSHRDLSATVLGAFGLVRAQPDVEKFGRSWLRLRLAPTAPLHRFVVTRSARAASGDDYSLPMAAIVEGRYKLIETFEDRMMELYEPSADPNELENLIATQPKQAAKLDDDLQLFRDVDRYP